MIINRNKFIKNLYLLKPKRLFLINNDPPIKISSFFSSLFKILLSKKQIENEINLKTAISNLIFVKNGRIAIYLFLKSIGVKSNDEVIVSAFNCFVVPEGVLLANAKPIYVDNFTFDSLDIVELRKKISEKTKCIIIPIMDGYAGNLESVLNLAKEKNIMVILDGAHTNIIPKKMNNLSIYEKADAIIQSFSHSKIFSLKSGGMLYLKDDKLYNKALEIQKKFNKPSHFSSSSKVVSLFLSRIIGNVAYLNIIYRVFDKLFVESEITQDEYEGRFEDVPIETIAKYKLLLLLENLKYFNDWDSLRIKYCELYNEKLKDLPIKIINHEDNNFIPLHFPIIVEDAVKLFYFLQKKSIHAERWFYPILYPPGVNSEKYLFRREEFPNSNDLSNQVLNLPTSPRLKIKDIEKIISLIIEYYKIR